MYCRHLKYYQPNVYHYHSTPWRYRSQTQVGCSTLVLYKWVNGWMPDWYPGGRRYMVLIIIGYQLLLNLSICMSTT